MDVSRARWHVARKSRMKHDIVLGPSNFVVAWRRELIDVDYHGDSHGGPNFLLYEKRFLKNVFSCDEKMNEFEFADSVFLPLRLLENAFTNISFAWWAFPFLRVGSGIWLVDRDTECIYVALPCCRDAYCSFSENRKHLDSGTERVVRWKTAFKVVCA